MIVIAHDQFWRYELLSRARNGLVILMDISDDGWVGIESWLQLVQLFRIHHLLPKGQERSKLCEKVDCPYRGDPLIKVLKCSGDDDQGAEFQPINLKNVFDELSASVEGSARILTGEVAGKEQYE